MVLLAAVGILVILVGIVVLVGSTEWVERRRIKPSLPVVRPAELIVTAERVVTDRRTLTVRTRRG